MINMEKEEKEKAKHKHAWSHLQLLAELDITLQ